MLPRLPITALHQIEITSRCNLSCVYCPSRDIMRGKYPDRPAMDMRMGTFLRCLEWAKHFCDAGTQDELNLAGIGESTMHPMFPEMLRMAREKLGERIRLTLVTNGKIADEEFVAKIAPYRPEVWVSIHRPELAAVAIDAYRRHGIFAGASLDPVTRPMNWSGQVAWYTSQPFACSWIRLGRVMAMSDGRLTACCLDAKGIGVVGHVNDVIGGVTLPYPLCKTCTYEIGIEGYDQRA